LLFLALEVQDTSVSFTSMFFSFIPTLEDPDSSGGGAIELGFTGN
jgi:hypothetical protein